MYPEAQFPQSDGVVRDGQRQFSGAAVDFLHYTHSHTHTFTTGAQRKQQEWRELKEPYHQILHSVTELVHEQQWQVDHLLPVLIPEELQMKIMTTLLHHRIG